MLMSKEMLWSGSEVGLGEVGPCRGHYWYLIGIRQCGSPAATAL